MVQYLPNTAKKVINPQNGNVKYTRGSGIMTERSKGSKEIVKSILNQPNMQTNVNDVLFPGANLLGKDELAKGLQHVAALENML